MANRNHVNIVLKGNNAIRRWRASHPRQQFDLRRVDFTHANIDGVDLRGANLELADFRWADLRGANLSRANLHRADFHKAVLIQTDLQCADLTFANLDDADLSGSLLDRAIFGRTTFNHSTLREASGLVSCVHRHPSELDPETIKRSPGLPIEFLRGCGVFAPYQAIVYRVVIGSPSDVKTERRVVRETINRWNELYSADLGVILRPVMWERHATPVLGVGDHPQM